MNDNYARAFVAKCYKTKREQKTRSGDEMPGITERRREEVVRES